MKEINKKENEKEFSFLLVMVIILFGMIVSAIVVFLAFYSMGYYLD